MNAIHSSELGVAAWVGERLTVGAGIEGQVDTLAVIPGTALLFGLMLAAAILGGYLAHLVRVPRVVGYLIAGIVLKAALHGLLQTDPLEQTGVLLAEAARPLKAITDIGLGVILFSIGGVFEARHFRPIGGRLLMIALGESGLTLLLVFAGTAAVGLILADGAATGTVLAFALLLGFASIATAPAATLFVVREYDAKGPVTDAILGLTGLNNIFCVVMFYLCFALLAASGLLGGVGLSSGTIWIDLVTMTVGSVVLGVAATGHAAHPPGGAHRHGRGCWQPARASQCVVQLPALDAVHGRHVRQRRDRPGQPRHAPAGHESADPGRLFRHRRVQAAPGGSGRSAILRHRVHRLPAGGQDHRRLAGHAMVPRP